MRKIKQKIVSNVRILQRTNKLLLGNKNNRRLFIAGFLLSCLATQAWALDAWVFGQVTNKLTGQESIFATVSILIAVLAIFVVDIIPRTIKYLVKIIELRFRKKTTEEAQQLYWRSYIKYDLQDRENPTMQDALNNANRNQDVINEIFSIQWGLGISFLTVIVAAIMLATIAWWYFFVVVLMVLPRVYLTRKRKVENYTQEKRLNEIRRYRGSLESYLGTKESTLNNSRMFYFNLFNSIRAKLNFIGYRNNDYFAKIGYWSDIWFYLLYAVLLYSVITMVAQGIVPVGTMFILFSSINRMFTELDAASMRWVDLEIATKRAEDFFLIIDSTPAIVDRADAFDIDNTRPPHIEFEDVYFKYPGTEQFVLEGATFEIKPGETLGLIAKNGEGKTTIGLLLLRFYDPTKGSIRINGIDLRLVKRSSLLKMTGALFQDFATLKTTVKGALLASKPENDYSDFQIWEILEKVGLKEYAENLPNKLNHKVDRIFKDSIKLSGGQNQKLALGGLIYRNPNFVILDEFTSSLDPEAEQEIVEQYRQVVQEKTALIISHRYLSLKIVDRIIVLQKGKIIESGKKEELLQVKDGVFKRLYTAAQLAINLN